MTLTATICPGPYQGTLILVTSGYGYPQSLLIRRVNLPAILAAAHRAGYTVIDRTEPDA